MGTNYYWYAPKPAACDHCGHAPEQQVLHIGKSSYGWAFALHVGDAAISENEGRVEAKVIQGLDDWQDVWRRGHIEDEYGKKVSPSGMLEVIMERRRGNYAPEGAAGERPNEIYLRSNHAEWDEEHGLLRHSHPVDAVGRGSGTWDLITGEFS